MPGFWIAMQVAIVICVLISAVIVAGLAVPGALIELSAVAAMQ